MSNNHSGLLENVITVGNWLLSSVGALVVYLLYVNSFRLVAVVALLAFMLIQVVMIAKLFHKEG